jgi:predicted O-methyltransferase YrrM
LAKQYNATGARFCNIGALHGYSTALLARGAPDAEVITLEPNKRRAQVSRKNLTGLSNVSVVEAMSWDYAGTGWDLVFVDGAHKQCHKDLIYYDRLRPGGLILFHDYVNSKFPEVGCAISELLERIGKDKPDIEVLADGRGGLAGVYRDG